MTNEQTIEIPLEVLVELNQVIKMQADQILLLQRIVNGEDQPDNSRIFAKVLQALDTNLDFVPKLYE